MRYEHALFTSNHVSLTPETILMCFDVVKHELSYKHMFRIVHSSCSWAVELYSIAGYQKKGKKKQDKWGRLDDGNSPCIYFCFHPKWCNFAKLDYVLNLRTMKWLCNVVIGGKNYFGYGYNEFELLDSHFVYLTCRIWILKECCWCFCELSQTSLNLFRFRFLCNV